MEENEPTIDELERRLREMSSTDGIEREALKQQLTDKISGSLVHEVHEMGALRRSPRQGSSATAQQSSTVAWILIAIVVIVVILIYGSTLG
jgi:hypothetical protein